MRHAEVIEEQWVTEPIHGDHAVPLVRQSLALPRRNHAQALAVERTTLPNGPTGPPIVLVHGFCQNRYTWRISGRSFSGHLASLGYEVLNMELRGHGNSRLYGSRNATCFDEYVQDAARVITACEQPPFVMGHSLGGGVLIGAVTLVPVAGLIHLAGIYHFGTQNTTIRTLARVSLRLERRVLASPLRMSTGWAGGVLGRLYRLTDLAGYGLPLAGWTPGSIERDLLEERLEKGFDWTSVEVWMELSRIALGKPIPYGEQFERSDLPLLVIAGDRDALVPPEEARMCFEASGSSDKTFVVFDAFDHQVHWGHVDLILGRKAPEEVWPSITEWLSERC